MDKHTEIMVEHTPEPFREEYLDIVGRMGEIAIRRHQAEVDWLLVVNERINLQRKIQAFIQK
jgi:hypothetical protein